MLVKRVGVFSAAKIAGGLYGAMGLLAGGIFALFSVFGASVASMSDSPDAPPPWFGVVFGLGSIVLFPVFYGVMGLLIGALTAWLYNLSARFVGGLEIEVQ